MEMLDLRNRDGSLTGEVKERSLVHRDGDLHGTVHIWLDEYQEVVRQVEAYFVETGRELQ